MLNRVRFCRSNQKQTYSSMVRLSAMPLGRSLVLGHPRFPLKVLGVATVVMEEDRIAETKLLLTLFSKYEIIFVINPFDLR